MKPQRNDLCPCGSGKKFKRCCGSKDLSQLNKKGSSAQQGGPSSPSSARLTSPTSPAQISRALQSALRHHQAGHLAQAEALYQQILRVQPKHPDALHLLGVIALQAGKEAIAEELISQAITVNPKVADYHLNLGIALKGQGKLHKAAKQFTQALRLKPDFPQAHYHLGNALLGLGQRDQAIASYGQALTFMPDYPEVHLGLGNAFKVQGRLEEAVGSYHEAIELKPDYIEAHINLGNALAAQGKLEMAMSNYRRALAAQPRNAQAHYNLGNALALHNKIEEAIASYRRTLSLKPDFAEAYNNLGNALVAQKRLEEATTCYQQALKSKPDYREALDNLIITQLKLCDWSNLAQIRTQLLDPALENWQTTETSPHPYNVIRLPLPLTPAEQQKIARAFVRKKCQPLGDLRQTLDFQHFPRDKERLRIGYISTDFRSHATAYLIQGLFARHDRTRFEIYAYSLGEDDGSAYRQRITQDCDQFRDVRPLSIKETARQIYEDGIDILIDLNGHTADNRLESLALRPAPVQVTYLGYPGTTGAEFIDYLITDRMVTPSDMQPYFDEQFVYLPDSYQVNDGDREIAQETPSRADCSLPEEGFVFCCFNNHYKIEPMIFDIWMRILKQVEGSVLWLLGGSDAVVENLRQEAKARGLASDRLVFGDKLPVSQHLARHRLADLFLDTHYYNAHTTASDALWAGLPILTCPGHTFASRVGASLLNAVGLPELVVGDFQAYEETAVRLARQPEELQILKSRLAENRLTYPLFDTIRFARHLERALERMWEIHRAGEKPRQIEVPANSLAC